MVDTGRRHCAHHRCAARAIFMANIVVLLLGAAGVVA
eukprot:COSAG02_NODE_62162_length_266_cov_1.209581_1_plen_36_part_10